MYLFLDSFIFFVNFFGARFESLWVFSVGVFVNVLGVCVVILVLCVGFRLFSIFVVVLELFFWTLLSSVSTFKSLYKSVHMMNFTYLLENNVTHYALCIFKL